MGAESGWAAGPRRPPAQIVFEGCPSIGQGGDPDLNLLKNRVDSPESANSVSVEDNLRIKATASRRHRATWTAQELQSIRRYEGTPIQVEGYLTGVKQERGESPNCGRTEASQVDYHLNLVARPDDDKSKSVVVEMTPRIRKDHDEAEWTIRGLREIATAKTRVRVTGWLMFDQVHEGSEGNSRGTLWEIHPITAFETVQP
ncbi:MAG TPA: hypothetical protein VFP84_27895 [Kofleriaceae bacterium]|nr:hypothetical protein [Kofleriaceae bacterium]